MTALDNLERREPEAACSDDKAGNPIMWGRKSVLMGLAASMGVAIVNATQSTSAIAGTVKPIAATTPLYAPRWTPLTVYALGQQVISPNNDVVSANTGHSSSTTFTADNAKWTQSSTFASGTEFTALAAAVAAIQAKIGTTPSGSGGTNMYNTAIYGTGIGFDCKGNVVINAEESMAMRFKAGATSTLTGIQWTQRMGSTGYSLGTGGTTTISIQTDNAGKPSGTKLAQTTWAGANNPAGEERHEICTFASPPALTAGTIYYAVFENPSASNYISANCAYSYGPNANAPLAVQPSPKQYMFNDTEFGILLTTAYGGAWSDTVSGAKGYTPVVDLIYANGYHDGQSYYENMVNYWGVISGTSSMVRETFIVSGGNRTVSRASVRIRRSSGTAPLVLTLETATGVAIDSGTIPAASIPIQVPNGGDGGAVWVTANFNSPRAISNGVAYNLRLSTAAGTTYTIDGLRSANGNYYGFESYRFKDGSAQKTTDGGSSWASLTVGSIWAAEPMDLGFYLS